MEIISYFRTFPFSSVFSIICKIVISTPARPPAAEPSISLIEEIAWESSSHAILPAESGVGQQMVNSAWHCLGMLDLLGQTRPLRCLYYDLRTEH